jgi:hypothetical protein
MNDETTGQLCPPDWSVPEYARDALWLHTESDAVQVTGEYGLFDLAYPARELTVRWGRDDGPALTQVRWQADNLHWRGEVRLAGMVEALHLTELPDSGIPMAITYVSAQPLKPSARPYPDAMQRRQPITEPDYAAALDDRFDPQTVTLITLEDSPLVSYARDSLLNHVPLHFYGSLPDDAAGWHQFFALPVVWESVTVFVP